MSYCLFKLNFTSPVHFGDSETAHSLDSGLLTCHADTLFSALCHAAYAMGGSEQVEWLIQTAQNDQVRFSDCMPWDAQNFYLPRPFHLPKKKPDVQNKDRKALKKAEWIPACEMEACLQTLRGEAVYDWSNAKNRSSFGGEYIIERAAVPAEDDAVPYAVGAFCFEPDKGLYFILQYQSEADRKQIQTLVQALGLSGIGGKTSVGYGKFELQDVLFLNQAEDCRDENTAWLFHALHDDGTKKMLLSAALAKESELETAVEDANFQLLRRSGFMHPITSERTLQKKKTQYFFAPGSVFSHDFTGEVFVVGKTESHAVYRYGKPLFLGVAL